MRLKSCAVPDNFQGKHTFDLPAISFRDEGIALTSPPIFCNHLASLQFFSQSSSLTSLQFLAIATTSLQLFAMQVRLAVDRNTDMAIFGGRCGVLVRYNLAYNNEGQLLGVDMVCATEVSEGSL
jgi:hypothetical protein